MRITPDYITRLEPNEIFVFGSNLAGFHGGGAARIAYEHFGAEWEGGRRSDRKMLCHPYDARGRRYYSSLRG